MSTRHALLSSNLRDACTCVICQDECVRLIRCPNGHPTCSSCALATGLADVRCAICREHRGTIVDSTIANLLVRSQVRLRCGTCDSSVLATECERHRAWCPKHLFLCPFAGCRHTCVSSDMAAHLQGVHHVPKVMCDSHGKWNAVLVLTPGTHDPACLVTCAGVVLMASVVSTPPLLGTGDTFLVVRMHAFYPSRKVPAVLVTLRQHRAHNLQRHINEHRCGVLPPMLASRETVPHRLCVPCIHVASSFHSHTSAFVATPWHKVTLPTISATTAAPIPTVVAHVEMHSEPDISIESLFGSACAQLGAAPPDGWDVEA